MAQPGYIVRIQGRRREFAWVLQAPNGKQVARSYENYVSARNARRAVEAIFTVAWIRSTAGVVAARSGPPG